MPFSEGGRQGLGLRTLSKVEAMSKTHLCMNINCVLQSISMPPGLIPYFCRDLTIFHKTSTSTILTNINNVLTGIITAINNVIIALLNVLINPSFSQH